MQDLYLHGYIGKIKSFIEDDIFDKDNVATMELIDLILNSIDDNTN